MSVQGGNRWGWIAIGVLLGAFLVLLVMIAGAPDALAIRTGTLSVGYWLVLTLHVLPVVLAYAYLKLRDREG